MRLSTTPAPRTRATEYAARVENPAKTSRATGAISPSRSQGRTRKSEEAADPEGDPDEVGGVRGGAEEPPRGGRGVGPPRADQDRRDREPDAHEELDRAGPGQRGRRPPGCDPHRDEEREAEAEAGGGGGQGR